MNKFISLFCLLFSFSAFAQVVPSGVPYIGTTGYQLSPAFSFTTPGLLSGGDGEFSLSTGDRNNLVAGDFYPLYRNGLPYRVGDQSGNYVTRSANCWGIVAVDQAGNGFQLVSATASFAYAAASITGGVYQCGQSGKYCYETAAATPLAYFAFPGTYTFGPGTYVGVQPGAASLYNFHMQCKEQ